MSSAGRPTFVSAKGGSDQGGNRMHVSTRQYSSKDLAGHTKMKQRQTGQNTSSEVSKRDLKRELEDKERKVAIERGRKDSRKEDKEDKREPVLSIKEKGESDRKERDKNIDADDSDESSEDESSDDESDSEDETDELLRELERIKKEREQERLNQEAAARHEADNRREETVLKGNPLLNSDGDYSIKRKWYDDVVFKNQARDEPETKKRFINDTTRNDFAKKFMKKYIQ